MSEICLLHISHWDQHCGGSEIQLKYLSRFLLKKGYEIHMIYMERGEPFSRESQIVYHPISYRKIPGIFGKSWFLYKKQIHRILDTIAPDIIITRMPTSWAGIAAEYSSTNNSKHLHFVASDNSVNKDLEKITYNKILDKIERQYFLKIYKYESEIFVQNDYQGKKIRENYGIKTLKVTQAVPENDASRIQKQSEKIKIVWVANLKPIKQPEKYLQIVEAFKNSHEVEFCMIGSDKNKLYNSLLEKYKQVNNFSYLGQLPNDKVDEVLDTSHVLINTSDYEGFSNTFVQAWLRKVVVLSLNSDPDKILSRQGIGYQTHSVPNTIERIQDLINKPELLNQLGKKSREYALQHHTFDNVYGKILKEL